VQRGVARRDDAPRPTASVGGRGLDREGVERAVTLVVEKYCAVLSTIAHAATIEHTTEIEEDAGAA